MKRKLTNLPLHDALVSDLAVAFNIDIILNSHQYAKLTRFIDKNIKGYSYIEFYFSLYANGYDVDYVDVSDKITDNDCSILEPRKEIVIYDVMTDLLMVDVTTKQFDIDNRLYALFDEVEELNDVVKNIVNDLVSNYVILHTKNKLRTYKGLNAYAFLKFHRGN